MVVHARNLVCFNVAVASLCDVGSVYSYPFFKNHDIGLGARDPLYRNHRPRILYLKLQKTKHISHEEFIQAHWKQALGSEIHCVAGDATAIIIAAASLHDFTLPNGWEMVIEYLSAWLFGLLIFQALFMRSMYPSYWSAVKGTVFAETVSMNFIMAGMLPTILVLKHYFPKGSNPLTLEFWGIMSAATIIGFAFAYPINSWLVKQGVKHGMMSAKEAGNDR